MGIENFNASNDWISSFRKRNNFTSIFEQIEPKQEEVEEYLFSDFESCLKEKEDSILVPREMIEISDSEEEKEEVSLLIEDISKSENGKKYVEIIFNGILRLIISNYFRFQKHQSNIDDNIFAIEVPDGEDGDNEDSNSKEFEYFNSTPPKFLQKKSSDDSDLINEKFGRTRRKNLSIAEKLQIIKLKRENNKTNAEIAAEMGIGKTTLHSILNLMVDDPDLKNHIIYTKYPRFVFKVFLSFYF